VTQTIVKIAKDGHIEWLDKVLYFDFLFIETALHFLRFCKVSF